MIVLDRRRLLPLMLCLVAATAGVAPGGAQAAEPGVYSSRGAAINGYDPVGYFRQNAPVKGKPAIEAQWNGATWRFASVENKEAFLADPVRYAPQYGGYCAWAVSQGYTASTDPAAFTIHNGKLYLNYSKRVERQWRKDIPGHVAAGDRNWPAVLSK